MANIGDIQGPDPFVQEFREIILERMKVASEGRISGQMMNDMDVRVREDALGMMADQLAVRLTTYVLTHRIFEECPRVPFSQKVRVPVTYEQTQDYDHCGYVGMGAAFLTLLYAGVTANLVLILASMVAAILSCASLWILKPRKRTITEQRNITVSGEVEVPVKYLNSFPENNMVYPDHLGRAVKIAMYDPPNFYLKPPKGDGA